MTARYPLVLNGTSIQELQTGDTITGLAASGANSDITSLSGLTTALSVAQGGSGAASFTAPSGNVKGLVFYDGTKLTNDTTVTDVGYDTSTNTVKANNFNATGTSTLGTLTGILKGATGVVSAASAGTDYVAPGGALGTPSSGTLTNATGLPISTGVSGLGTGVATALAVNVGSSGAVVANGGALGTPSSGTLSSCTVDGTNGVGYINIPQNSQSAAYTLVASDAGKHIFHPSTDNNARTFTIPANGSVAYPIGTSITFVNMAATASTIAITTDTMYLAGTGTTGSRTLAQYGVATAIKLASTTWIISGNGLT